VVILEAAGARKAAQLARRPSVLFAPADRGCEKFERTADHLGYALFLHPNILLGLLVKTILKAASKVGLRIEMKTNEPSTDFFLE
jgi:hypothetical protein